MVCKISVGCYTLGNHSSAFRPWRGFVRLCREGEGRGLRICTFVFGVATGEVLWVVMGKMTMWKACLQGAVTTGSFMQGKVVIAAYIQIVSRDN